MIRIILILSIISQITYGDIYQEWTKFKEIYGKSYANQIIETEKYNNFIENLKFINKHNSAGVYSFKVGVNHLADLNRHEYFNIMLTDIKPKTRRPLLKNNRNEPLPDQIDWREKGCVSPVQDQGQSGQMALFSAVGALEGQECQIVKKFVSLSVQQLVDCCTPAFPSVLEYYKCVKDQGGLDAAGCYPSKGQNQCKFDPQCTAVVVNGFSEVNKGDEKALKSAVALMGPVSVCVDASRFSFQFYSSGIYDDPLCSPDEVNHCMLVVGYGTDNGIDYWLVKNSWGQNWGESGYIRMVRNKRNRCGIASFASYPSLKTNSTAL